MTRQSVQYHSLDELRAEKQRVGKRLGKKVKKLQTDVAQTFTPDRSFVDSSIPYMRYIGYAITGFKVARKVKKIVDFARRRKWF